MYWVKTVEARWLNTPSLGEKTLLNTTKIGTATSAAISHTATVQPETSFVVFCRALVEVMDTGAEQYGLLSAMADRCSNLQAADL